MKGAGFKMASYKNVETANPQREDVEDQTRADKDFGGVTAQGTAASLAPKKRISGEDVRLILTPFASKNPAGENLRYHSIWDEIRQARKQEEDLPQGVWQHELKKADWDQVIDLCVGVLKNQSKDLQVALWLTEGLYQKRGLEGLEQGLLIVQQLLVLFKDTFHPYSQDDPEYRVSPLLWFDLEMLKRFNFQQLNKPQDVTEKSYAFWEYDELIKKGGSDKGSAQAGELSPKQSFEASIRVTPQSFYKDNIASLKNALKAIQGIENFVVENFSDFPKILRHIDQKLQAILSLFEKLEKNARVVSEKELQGVQQSSKQEEQMQTQTYNEQTAVPTSVPHSAPHSAQGDQTMSNNTSVSPNISLEAVNSREEAYRRLAEIAAYLKHVEPHSPTPYLIERAVRWGNMSLGDVMRDLTQSGTSIEQALHLLGIHGGDRPA